MKELYAEYINYMAPRWSESSVRSERQRLNRLWPVIDGDPDKLWAAMAGYGAYARCTYWGRIVSFWDWRIKKRGLPGPNPYAIFREENPRFFRNAYVKKPCERSVEDLRKDIDRIPGEYQDVKNKLNQLLDGGLRRTESYTLTEDGYVTGKGGKVRKVYIQKTADAMAGPERYSTMLRLLKEYAGVTPHKLRSAKMTDMVNRGANIYELTKFAGWSRINTAESYVLAREERIRELAEGKVKEITAEAEATGLVRKMFGWAFSKVRENVE
jgi:integrase